MNRSDIFEQIKTICLRIFGALTIITEETASSDVENWDSMNHVVLISNLESEFDIKFDLMEIIELNTIRDFVDAIDKKLA